MLLRVIKYIFIIFIVDIVLLFIIMVISVDIVSYKNTTQAICDIAVVEGWILDDDINYLKNTLKKYRKIYVIGGKIDNFKDYLPYDDLSDITRDRLMKKDIKVDIIAIHSVTTIDRTFNAIYGLKKYLKGNECIDYFTLQRHSYRSYINFKYIFPKIEVYIHYKLSKKLENWQWLKESGEFKEIIMELISILYTKIRRF